MKKPNREGLGFEYGGEEEDRTPDLVIANDALSQLSYPPKAAKFYMGFKHFRHLKESPAWAPTNLRYVGSTNGAFCPSISESKHLEARCICLIPTPRIGLKLSTTTVNDFQRQLVCSNAGHLTRWPQGLGLNLILPFPTAPGERHWMFSARQQHPKVRRIWLQFLFLFTAAIGALSPVPIIRSPLRRW